MSFAYYSERETGIEGGIAHKPSKYKEESTLSGAVLKFVLNEKLVIRIIHYENRF